MVSIQPQIAKHCSLHTIFITFRVLRKYWAWFRLPCCSYCIMDWVALYSSTSTLNTAKVKRTIYSNSIIALIHIAVQSLLQVVILTDFHSRLIQRFCVFCKCFWMFFYVCFPLSWMVHVQKPIQKNEGHQVLKVLSNLSMPHVLLNIPGGKPI